MELKQLSFSKQKQDCLLGIDLSRKGSVDEPISQLVTFINEHDAFFTTSSCSGRSALFEYPSNGAKKQGCIWLYTTHGRCEADAIVNAVTKSTGDACFKFEPFVLHVQCRSLHHAQKLLSEAVASGHRNSGISIGRKGKIIVAVRSTHCLEVPVTHDGKCLVTDEYLQYITELANRKMQENKQRIERFQNGVENLLLTLRSDGAENKAVNSKKPGMRVCNVAKGAAPLKPSTNAADEAIVPASGYDTIAQDCGPDDTRALGGEHAPCSIKSQCTENDTNSDRTNRDAHDAL